MNFCGLICEFNPFHNGHKYIIEEAKKLTGLDVVCLMSGDFVQRGTPAIIDKYERAKSAILAGANTVLELTTIYACSNAENFATGAIKIFKSLGIKKLAFGIEDTNIEILKQIAKLKLENSERFKLAFKNEIQNGINYNTALKRSIAKTIGDDSVFEILNKPNNILAIEYLTAILKLDADIEPIAIKRTDNGYVSEKPNNEFLSASAIRDKILANECYSKFVPKFAILPYYFSKENLSTLDSLNLLTIRSSSAEKLSKHYDYSEGIEYRVKKICDSASSLSQAKNEIATPRYRIARVNKLLLYPLLCVTKDIVDVSQKTKPVVKVLAIQKNNKFLISNANKRKISLIVTNKDYENLSANQKKIANIDLLASNIYSCITNRPNDLDKKIGTMFL